jgi:hypothetical protein
LKNSILFVLIGTVRRELPDHVIVLSQNHLERLLKEFIEDYYHLAGPHQGLAVQELTSEIQLSMQRD